MIAAFDLPAELDATAPPPSRDGVRLLVARPDRLEHARFRSLGAFLAPGDLLVVNTSGTLAAAIDGIRHDGRAVTVHFAAALDEGQWVVEVRPAQDATGPVGDSHLGDVIALPGGVRVALASAHPVGQTRLWRASVGVEGSVTAYLERYGRPIRYAYVPRALPLVEYQTVFAREPGSAEMPSAGRPFTTQLVTELVSQGVGIAPITLHAGVSSQDVEEPPQSERFVVRETTARLINMTRAWGGRVVAVGTTAARAVESTADTEGVVRRHGGWTDLVLGPERPARVVNGLITGWHAPGASHLKLLEAVAGTDLVDRAYREAVRARYLWHEFGDSCLLLP